MKLSKKVRNQIASKLVELQTFGAEAETQLDIDGTVNRDMKRFNRAAKKLNKLLGFKAITNLYAV